MAISIERRGWVARMAGTEKDMQAWKKTASGNIRRMSVADCIAWGKKRMERQKIMGVSIGDPEIRAITGGFSSQSIDFYIIREIGLKAKYGIKESSPSKSAASPHSKKEVEAAMEHTQGLHSDVRTYRASLGSNSNVTVGNTSKTFSVADLQHYKAEHAQEGVLPGVYKSHAQAAGALAQVHADYLNSVQAKKAVDFAQIMKGAPIGNKNAAELTEDNVLSSAVELVPMLRNAGENHKNKEYLSFLNALEKKYGKDFRVRVWNATKKLLGEAQETETLQEIFGHGPMGGDQRNHKGSTSISGLDHIVHVDVSKDGGEHTVKRIRIKNLEPAKWKQAKTRAANHYKKQGYTVHSTEHQNFNEEINEEVAQWELKKIHKEYKDLKNTPTADVLKTHKRMHKISSTYDAGEMGGKEGLISDIMHHRHGEWRMAAYHTSKPSERKRYDEAQETVTSDNEELDYKPVDWQSLLSEGKVKELKMDLKDLTDAEFVFKYKKTKTEMRRGLTKMTEEIVEAQEVHKGVTLSGKMGWFTNNMLSVPLEKKDFDKPDEWHIKKAKSMGLDFKTKAKKLTGTSSMVREWHETDGWHPQSWDNQKILVHPRFPGYKIIYNSGSGIYTFKNPYGKKLYSGDGEEDVSKHATKILGTRHTRNEEYDSPDKSAKAQRIAKMHMQQAHRYNLDAAQREMDDRESKGEDMTGARIHPKTYEIIKANVLKRLHAYKHTVEHAPVAPVPDKKYIIGTPEYKAYKKTKKPINGVPTNVKLGEHAPVPVYKNEFHYRKYIIGTPEWIKYNKKKVGSKRWMLDPVNDHPTNVKLGEDLQEASHVGIVKKTFDSTSNPDVFPDHIGKDNSGNVIVRKQFFYAHGKTSADWNKKVTDALTAAGVKHTAVDHGATHKPFNGGASTKNSTHWWSKIKIDDPKPVKEVTEEVELQESKGRSFAMQGKMHPDMAKHYLVGLPMDYYHPYNGDKVSGKVVKKTDKEVHIKADHAMTSLWPRGMSPSYFKPKSGMLAAGAIHVFHIADKIDKIEEQNKVTYKNFMTFLEGVVNHEAMAKELFRTHGWKAKKSDVDAMRDACPEPHKIDPHEIWKHYAKYHKAKINYGGRPLKQTIQSESRESAFSDWMNGKLSKPSVFQQQNQYIKSAVNLAREKNIADARQHKLARDDNKIAKLNRESRADDIKDKLAADRETKLNNYDFSKLNVVKKNPITKVLGHSYGAGSQNYDADDENEDETKVNKSAAPAQKRGRGRPAGSKSGARP